MQFAGKQVLVTGAGSGVGQAVATAFAQADAHVIVHDISDVGRAVAMRLGGAFVQADLSDRAAVRRLAADVAAAYGRVDILVNNAGFQHISPVDAFDEERWVAMMQVMLIAPFQLTSALLPAMKAANWGRIINIASIHGLVASPFKSAYISAKHGLIGLTKTVALEAADAGVTVNAICPAYVRTPLVERQIAEQARTRGIPEDQVIAQVMLEPAAIKRLIEPEEVADLALYLASDRASAITGAAHLIDLGWTAR